MEIIKNIVNLADGGNLYFVLEGPDKIGKTTVAEILKRMFAEYTDCEIFQQPYRFREQLLYEEDLSDYQRAIMFLADHEVSLQDYMDYNIIIGDRTALVSTIVYQWDGMNDEELVRYSNISSNMTRPTVVFILNGKSKEKVSDDTIYEQRFKYEDMQERYNEIGDQLSICETVNADGSPEEVALRILYALYEKLSGKLNPIL